MYRQAQQLEQKQLTYSESQSVTMPIEDIPPLYLKNSELVRDGNTILHIHICKAVVRIVNASKVEGVQRIGNLWMIFLTERAARLDLYNKGTLLIQGRNHTLYDDNPYTATYKPSDANTHKSETRHNDKLTIRNVPMWVENSDIKTMLEGHGVKLVSAIRYGLIRDEDGQLTDFKSGERYVYVKSFDPPLARRQQVNEHPCIIIHHGKETQCIACGKTGHKIGAADCPAKPKEEIKAFRGYTSPLSNHFECNLYVYDEDFISLEHAYFWRMATEFNKEDLAAKIKNSRHAGIAKSLSKEIASEEERQKWEEENIEVMERLLKAKAEQCEVFRIALLKHEQKTLAEATHSKLWGSGLSEYATTNTDPAFWPGRNMLGILLSQLALQIKEEEGRGNRYLGQNPPQVEAREALQAEKSSEAAVSGQDEKAERAQPSSQETYDIFNRSNNKSEDTKQNENQNGATINNRDKKSQQKKPSVCKQSDKKRTASTNEIVGNRRIVNPPKQASTRGRTISKSPAKYRAESMPGRQRQSLTDIKSALNSKRKAMDSSLTEDDKKGEPQRKKEAT